MECGAQPSGVSSHLNMYMHWLRVTHRHTAGGRQPFKVSYCLGRQTVETFSDLQKVFACFHRLYVREPFQS